MRDLLPRARALFCASATLALCLTACQEPKPPFEPPDLDPDLAERTDLPPVSGGTLLVLPGATKAVAADSDHDAVWIVDLTLSEAKIKVALEERDEPGRLVLDGRGLVHVVLRGAGAVATIEPETGQLVGRTPVCTWPRGLAYDAAQDALHVACAEGKLVTVAPQDGAVKRSIDLGPDLRDVVVVNGHLLVSRLRTADVITVDPSGQVVETARPPTLTTSVSSSDVTESDFTPTAAWRLIPRPDGGAMMVHQRGQVAPVVITKPGGYGGGGTCGGIVHGAVTRLDVDGSGHVLQATDPKTRLPIALPVDVAISESGGSVAVAGAGSKDVAMLTAADLDQSGTFACQGGTPIEDGMPVAVAFVGEDVVVQTRAPAAVLMPTRSLRIDLGFTTAESGHGLFHTSPNGTVACASCHPEGREDAHVWTFDEIGPRRSQSLRIRLDETLPLHWDGDMADLSAIMDEVFVHRMGGAEQDADHKEAIAAWLQTLPALPSLRPADDEAAARGKILFERADVACATCHSGPLFTNNQNEDVGKGDELQVPSLLGVAWRAPLMHDGCAATLRDRFDPACGGSLHGDLSSLDAADLDDLVAYLETL